MKAKITFLVLALGASTCLLTAQDNASPSDTQPPPQRAGGPGGRGGFHLLPPRAQEVLKLTDAQKTQIAALETETRAKLEKILTPEQLQQLKNMHPPMRPGGSGGQGQGNGPGAGDNSVPPGPPPGEDGGNNPPSGPPPGGN
jgi:Spy/CpxP family protein refolding chaperone